MKAVNQNSDNVDRKSKTMSLKMLKCSLKLRGNAEVPFILSLNTLYLTLQVVMYSIVDDI